MIDLQIINRNTHTHRRSTNINKGWVSLYLFPKIRDRPTHTSFLGATEMVSKENVTIIQDILVKEYNLSKRWIEAIIDLWKEEANEVNTIDDIQQQISSWKWIEDSSSFLWEIMSLLEYNPAPSAFLLTIDYISQKNTDLLDISFKERERYTQRIRRALTRLYMAGLVDVYTIDPEEIPEGIRVPTLYIAPFANERDIEKSKKFYKTRDGSHGFKKRKQDDTLVKQVSEHNHRVKAYTIINRYRENYQVFNYYKCPKNHSEGLIRKKKTNRKTKEALRPVKCDECGNILEKIKFEEFFKLIETDILKRWDLKK